MALIDLIDYIYRPKPNTPRCAHCQRPLLIATQKGTQFLYCKHCGDLEREEKEEKKFF